MIIYKKLTYPDPTYSDLREEVQEIYLYNPLSNQEKLIWTDADAISHAPFFVEHRMGKWCDAKHMDFIVIKGTNITDITPEEAFEIML